MNKFAVIDVETGGLDPYTSSLLQVGVIILNEELKELTRFYRDIKWPTYEVTPGALNVNGINILQHDNIATDHVLVRFALEGFLSMELPQGEKLIFTGQNPQFDRGFLDRFLPGDSMRRLFHYRMMDLSTLGRACMLLEPETFENHDISSLDGQLMFFEGIKRNSHNALEDAHYSAEMFRRMLDFLR